jgi:phosphoglycolate phosphatase
MFCSLHQVALGDDRTRGLGYRGPMRLVLFDIDGTMLHSHGAGSRAMERVGRTLLGPDFSLAGIDFGGALDPWIYREALLRIGRCAADDDHERFHEAYVVELARELAEGRPLPSVLPGVAEALALLSTRPNVTLGLVTGNYARAAALKLRAAGIDPELFRIGAFGDDAPTRPDLVRLALERWAAAGAHAHPDAVVVIGDTPRDVDCAHRNGCRCLAVATGRHSRQALIDAGADFVADDLSDLTPLFQLLALP